MLTSLFLLLQPQGDLPALDRFVRGRNVKALTERLAPLPPGATNPFLILSSGGPYDVGNKGWRAYEAAAPAGDDRFVVFSTPLTSQDSGELLFRRQGDKLQFVPETETMGVRIVRHDLDVIFQPAQGSVKITDRLAIRKIGATRPYFALRLSPGYVVSSVKDSAGGDVRFAQAGGVVLVTTPAPSEPTIHLTYEAKPNLRLFAGSVNEREAMLTNDYWYPMIARLPAPYSVRVTAPKGWTTVAQGEPVGEETRDDLVITRHRMDLPTVFYSLSSGPYRTLSRETNGKRYTVWGTNLTDQQMQVQLDLMPPIIEFFEKQFGGWPFKRFGALQSSAYGYGALEAYTFATYGGWLPAEDPHEPSHTLFGGVLNNSYLKSFWNESFASYSEGLYRREVGIGSVADRRLAFIQTPEVDDASYKAAPLSKAGPELGGVASALGYGKGAYVLQMLEQMAGTERLSAVVSRWIRERPLDRTVEWEDFERVMVASAPDLPIKRFFDHWIHRPGYADFTIGSLARQGNGVSFNVQFNGQPFIMPLEVMLESADGRRDFRKVIVPGDSPRHEVKLVASFEVAQVPWTLGDGWSARSR
jgi:hypothetical protein